MLNSAYSGGGFVINTNMASLLVQRNLANVTNDMTTLMEQLSTNLKVNRASDDPSGMAISNNYQKQISSIEVAKNNSQTGVSLLQTAENDLKTIQTNLSLMKNVIIQSQTGTTTDAQRIALDSTFQQYLTEIQRLTTTSNYSGIKLLDGSAGSLKLQVDINNTSDSRIDISDVVSNMQTSAGGALNSILGTKVSTVTLANSAQALINSAYDLVSQKISLTGAYSNRLTNNIKRLESRSENLQASNSLIRDTDVASATARLTKAQIMQQTSVSLLQQANSSSALILKLIGS